MPTSSPTTVVGEVLPRFEFASAGRLVFGAGTAAETGSIAHRLGRRCLLVTGGTPERATTVARSLEDAGLEVFPCRVSGEPTLPGVSAMVHEARRLKVDLVVGCGGGSAIDAAKAVAGLAANPGEALDYLEVVGRGQPLPRPALPWIAVPTTAGAGAEVTKNAVLTSPEHRVKASLRSPALLARVAIVDPQLALGLPPSISAATGLDALTQLIEPFVCSRPNPMVDALCLEAIPRAARALPVVCREGSNLAARSEMALAALHGGLALANAGLGVVHGLAAPIGGSFPAPHGAVCAALLPHGVAANLAALRRRHPGHPALARYRIVARLLTGSPDAVAEDAVPWLGELVTRLGIPPLRDHGLRAEHLPDLARKAAASSSMKANPIPLEEAEIVALLEAAT